LREKSVVYVTEGELLTECNGHIIILLIGQLQVIN